MGAPVSKKWRIRLRAAFVLLALWTVVALATRSVDRRKPSELTALRFLEEHPIRSGLRVDQRKQLVERLATQITALEGDERQRMLMNERMRDFIQELTEDEKSLFLQLTLVKGIPEMMEGFDTAQPERRLRWINQALTELEQLQSDDRPKSTRPLDDATAQQIAEMGLVSYWRDADATARLELQPLLERIQSILQVPR
jgi:hypothetical protein